MKYADFYIELFVDIAINIETFCLDEEQKAELKEHLERYWHRTHKEDMLREANDKVFEMRIREVLEDG